LPQGTLHREAAATIVSTAAERVDVQKASTRIALQSSLPAAQPRTAKARVASVKVVKVSTPTPANAPLFSPAPVEPKVVASTDKVTKVVESKIKVATKTEVRTETETVTRIATLPRQEVKPVEKKAAPVMRRAQPTVLASRRSVMPDGNSDLLLLAQLERELQTSKKQLRRANAHLSEGQRELQKFNGVLRQAMLEAGPDAKGLHPFVRVAQRYAGTPYVWGGESARGFDCSGFIIRVMRDLGYKALPHSAATQFNYGMPVAQALLKPGDLVFFANTYKPGISHVGIYLGKRRFIHAAGTGLGTIVSNLDSPKFQSKYAGARRLVSVR
jgi:cell wall-associated NlpC family hydrolase